MRKLMTSVPGLALASRMSCLNEPVSESLVFLTVKVVAVASGVEEDFCESFSVCSARDTGEGRVSEIDIKRLRTNPSFTTVILF